MALSQFIKGFFVKNPDVPTETLQLFIRAADVKLASAKTTEEAIVALQETVATFSDFLTGEDDSNGTIDRLKELVAEISANKTSIAEIVAGYAKKEDIVDDLVSTDVDKPLSANQGRALKTLIDGLPAGGGGSGLRSTKVTDTVPTEWPADMHPDGIIFVYDKTEV